MQIPRNKERERRAQDRIEAQIANRLEGRLQREIAASIRDGVEAYENERSIDSAVAQHDEAIERSIERMYTDAYTQIGERVLGQLEQAAKSGPPMERKELPDSIQRALRNFARTYLGRKVSEISNTTRDWIRRRIQIGLEDGLDISEVASSIRDRASDIGAYRAHMISRTETHSAANSASYEVAKESGMVRRKIWVDVDDGRTRGKPGGKYEDAEFRHYNVEPVPINEPFIVSGEELMYPGDPDGSPGNIINCRCALVYETS